MTQPIHPLITAHCSTLTECADRDKMLRGELYDAGHPALFAERLRAQDLCFDLNNTRPSNLEGRKEIIRELLPFTQPSTHITSPFYCDYGYNIVAGKNFYTNYNTVLLDICPIIIGDNVMFAPNVQILGAFHPLPAAERNSGLELGGKIVIGDNVWLGAGVTVLPGVTIGAGCVVGAGSTVNRDLPPNSLAVGVPARVLRTIDQGEDRAALAGSN